MQKLDLTQGDDWDIDLYLEELVGDVWQPVNISGVTFAMTLNAGAYEQAMTIAKISLAGGHARASLANAQTQLAPVGVLMSNVQMTQSGKKASAGPLAINCIEDFTV